MAIPRSTSARIAAIVIAALALLLVVSQLILPGIGEGAIEERLTENGGIAEVSLGAVPAARLLWGNGNELAISATGLSLALDERNPEVLEDLDRFGEVEIAIADSHAGPIELESFALTRSGDEPYALVSRGTTSAADLGEFFAANNNVPGSGLIGDVIGDVIGATGVGGADLPLELDMRLEAGDGSIRVTEGGGEIAGVPTGPLAELLTNAIVERL